jgi:hypothetical protein
MAALPPKPAINLTELLIVGVDPWGILAVGVTRLNEYTTQV